MDVYKRREDGYSLPFCEALHLCKYQKTGIHFGDFSYNKQYIKLLFYIRICSYIIYYLPLSLVSSNAVPIMIKSFGDKQTENIWNGIRSKKLSVDVQNAARRKLRMINNAQNINDLRIPPANHLEKLNGKLSGFHSIRINKQWRIIFIWKNDNTFEVQIVDYH